MITQLPPLPPQCMDSPDGFPIEGEDDEEAGAGAGANMALPDSLLASATISMAEHHAQGGSSGGSGVSYQQGQDLLARFGGFAPATSIVMQSKQVGKAGAALRCCGRASLGADLHKGLPICAVQEPAKGQVSPWPHLDAVSPNCLLPTRRAWCASPTARCPHRSRPRRCRRRCSRASASERASACACTPHACHLPLVCLRCETGCRAADPAAPALFVAASLAAQPTSHPACRHRPEQGVHFRPWGDPSEGHWHNALAAAGRFLGALLVFWQRWVPL